MDPTVVQAAYSAAQSGLLTPLIKEELRCTIQTKRLKKGEDELVVEHTVKMDEEVIIQSVLYVISSVQSYVICCKRYIVIIKVCKKNWYREIVQLP